MKIASFPLLAVVVAIAFAPAGTGAGAATRASAGQQLIQLEQDYAKALIRKDRDFLMQYYAPDWRGGNWLGFWTKSTMIRAVLGERYVTRSMKLRDLSVRVIGNVGIVQGVDDETTMVDGKNTSGKWSFTDIFERRNGRWVAVASHTSEIAPVR